MLGNRRQIGKWASAKRWQTACNQSNVLFTEDLALTKSLAIVQQTPHCLGPVTGSPAPFCSGRTCRRCNPGCTSFGETLSRYGHHLQQ